MHKHTSIHTETEWVTGCEYSSAFVHMHKHAWCIHTHMHAEWETEEPVYFQKHLDEETHLSNCMVGLPNLKSTLLNVQCPTSLTHKFQVTMCSFQFVPKMIINIGVLCSINCNCKLKRWIVKFFGTKWNMKYHFHHVQGSKSSKL